MSTNVNPTSAISPEDLASLRKHLDALEAESGNANNVKPQESAPPAQTNEPPKFTVKIGGQDVTGTQAEVQAAFTAYEAARNNTPAPVTERTVKADDKPSYDKEQVRRELVAKLENDPVEGFRYGINSAAGFDVFAALKFLAQGFTAQNQEISGLIFRERHPEWEPNQENVTAVEKVMQQYNVPSTLEGMELAFQAAKAQGMLKLRGEQAEEIAQAQAPSRPTPPPRISHTAAQPSGQPSETELLALLEQMPLEDLYKLTGRNRQ